MPSPIYCYKVWFFSEGKDGGGNVSMILLILFHPVLVIVWSSFASNCKLFVYEGFHKGFHFSKVIEEIEEMMQESPDPEEDETPTQSDRLSILSQEIQTLKRSSTNNSYEESKWYLYSIYAYWK